MAYRTRKNRKNSRKTRRILINKIGLYGGLGHKGVCRKCLLHSRGGF